MFFRRKKHIKELSDEDLVERYQETLNQKYMGELFDRHTHLVFLVCMKYLKNEAESRDAVMQIFEKLIQNLERYNIQKFKPWLHTVTRNHCFAILDKQKRRMEQQESYRKNEEEFMENSYPSPLQSEDSIEEIRLKHLEEAIGRLKDEQKVCVELFYLQQKCYKEVAEITGFSLKQVKSYIQNGKRNLKKHLIELSKPQT